MILDEQCFIQDAKEKYVKLTSIETPDYIEHHSVYMKKEDFYELREKAIKQEKIIIDGKEVLVGGMTHTKQEGGLMIIKKIRYHKCAPAKSY